MALALILPFLCPSESQEYPPYRQRPHHIMYAPWRKTYDTTISKKENSEVTCPLCDSATRHEDLVVHRGKNVFVILARQPYVDKNDVHFLITPHTHIKDLHELPPATGDEINRLTQKLCAFFSDKYHEICINTNQGKAAGASVPDHYHKHVIITANPAHHNLVQAVEQTKNVADLAQLSQNLQRAFVSLSSTAVPLPAQTASWDHNCYFCHLINDKSHDKKNLVIHRGKNVLITFSHFPTSFGEIDIIPYSHTTALERMDQKTYNEMNLFTQLMQPLILNLLEAQDSNIGLISYGSRAHYKEHIRQRIIPRKESWNTSPITNARHLNGDIKQLYERILVEWGRKSKL